MVQWSRIMPYALMSLGVALVVLASQVIVPPGMQLYLAVLTMLCALVVDHRKGHAATLLLVSFSLFVSLRYMCWRILTTLHFDNWFQALLTMALIFAEVYSWIILFLGYVQLAWPLARKEQPLPHDRALWPTVDVYIPTYNEDLSVVRNTVLAAKAMDWAEGKVKVYILDDGRRPEFALFAQEADVGYITRPDNRHAKAGNLNHAMRYTDGEVIAVFDCDHIPVKSFLTRTVGWMVANPRIALVQTPQHFYSLNPFQRNLVTREGLPPEGNLFYGLIQPGNDFWNATLFCGSNAVLRREALDHIHGFAVETVTEDAHTSLKLQRKGWETAYLRETLAGGLATESLALHIGQRVRWARGMVQIFRVDNPLLHKGLRLGQRLCYLAAMLHFFFPLPRLVFLLAPLAFLFMGQSVINAAPLAVMMYAIPHLFHSSITQSRMHGRWRYSFWGDVYETSLAPFLMPVVLKAFFMPWRATFNVTAKGGMVEHDYLDARMIWPNVVVCALLTLGVLVGAFGMYRHAADVRLFQVYLMSVVWAIVNAVVVMGAIAVGYERRQIRRAHRLPAQLDVTVTVTDGETQTSYPGQTIDISKGGLSVRTAQPVTAPSTMIMVTYVNERDGIRVEVPACIMGQQNTVLRLEWRSRNLQDEAAIVGMVFGRSDTWLYWDDFRSDKPWRSLLLLLRSNLAFMVSVLVRGRGMQIR